MTFILNRVSIDKDSQGNFKSIEPSYFLEAMDMYRQELRYNKLYFSDKIFFFQKGRFHLCVWWCWLGQETATSTGKRDLMDRTATTKYICFCSKNHLLCQCFLSPGENRRPLLCGRSFGRKRCSILTARAGGDNCVKLQKWIKISSRSNFLPGKRPGHLGFLQPHNTFLWHLWLLGRLPRGPWKGDQVRESSGFRLL